MQFAFFLFYVIIFCEVENIYKNMSNLLTKNARLKPNLKGFKERIKMEQEVQAKVETETTTTENVEKNSEEVVKTFTQEEVNGIVKERLAKVKKDLPSKEELAKYNEWKESQKSQQDKYDDLLKNSTEKDHTISNLEKENAVLKAGILDQDEIEFICYKVGKMDGDFNENLTQYLANNPKYTKKQETKATGIETKQQSAPQENGVTAILKAKHPELFN